MNKLATAPAGLLGDIFSLLNGLQITSVGSGVSLHSGNGNGGLQILL